MKTAFALIAAIIACSGHAGASGYSTGFNTGYDYARDLAGQEGWEIDDLTSGLSFFVEVNGSIAGALGGYYNAPPGPALVKLSHPVGIPLARATFSVSIVVLGSTAKFPGRDSFAWGLADPSGASLFTLGFEPAANDAGLLNITWAGGDGSPVTTGRAVFMNAPYQVDVMFGTGSGPDLPFSATLTGSDAFTFSGVLPGMAGKTWDSIAAHYIIRAGTAGDNFMAFDDLAAVPAPVTDADGDGYPAEMEAWFGTSDTNSGSTPAPVFSLSAGTASLTFPSISGRDYFVDSSSDLKTWDTTIVTATAATTHWLDPAGPAPRHRYFKIRKP